MAKGAVVVTAPLRAVLYAHYGHPKLRGDELVQTLVPVYLRNAGRIIQMHYYGSAREGSGRDAEERCWHEFFAKYAYVGATFTVEFVNNRIEIEFT
jgi:hypothetical protein